MARTAFIPANGLTFETDIAGSGGKFALCLHGFPESKQSWRFQLPFLATLGYEVWAPNLRGYGGSSRPRGVANYAIDRLTDDVAGLIDAGAQGRPVTLLAHDWGALVAWAFAADAKRALDRLVIMNVPHPGVFFDLIRTDREQRRKSWYVAFFQAPWLPEWLLTASDARGVRRAFHDMAVDKTNFGPEVLDAYAANARLPGAMTAMINYYRANFGQNGPMARFARGMVAPIETPTLLIWGEADTALSVRGAEGYEGLVRDLMVRRLPNVSHWVQQEAPDTVNALLGEWLGAPRPGPARG